MQRVAAAVFAIALIAGAGAWAVEGAGAPAHDPKDHRFEPPAPESLGGSFALRDIAGRTVTMEALRGRWTLIYFGYSRCTDTCPLALPTMVEAARVLNTRRVPTRAVFVDIEPPGSTVRPRNAAISTTSLGHHAKSGPGSPLVQIQEQFGSSLLALTGSRAQLNAATVAFGVRREHVPPRPQEEGHSINHTSFIYIVAPDGKVKGYVLHDVTATALISNVRRRAQGRT